MTLLKDLNASSSSGCSTGWSSSSAWCRVSLEGHGGNKVLFHITVFFHCLLEFILWSLTVSFCHRRSCTGEPTGFGSDSGSVCHLASAEIPSSVIQGGTPSLLSCFLLSSSLLSFPSSLPSPLPPLVVLPSCPPSIFPPPPLYMGGVHLFYLTFSLLLHHSSSLCISFPLSILFWLLKCLLSFFSHYFSLVLFFPPLFFFLFQNFLSSLLLWLHFSFSLLFASFFTPKPALSSSPFYFFLPSLRPFLLSLFLYSSFPLPFFYLPHPKFLHPFLIRRLSLFLPYFFGSFSLHFLSSCILSYLFTPPSSIFFLNPKPQNPLFLHFCGFLLFLYCNFPSFPLRPYLPSILSFTLISPCLRHKTLASPFFTLHILLLPSFPPPPLRVCFWICLYWWLNHE